VGLHEGYPLLLGHGLVLPDGPARAAPTPTAVREAVAAFGTRYDDFSKVVHHDSVVRIPIYYTQVNALTGKVIRVVAVRVSEAWAEAHRVTVTVCFALHVPFAWDTDASDAPVPAEIAVGRHTVSGRALRFALRAARQLRAMFQSAQGASAYTASCSLASPSGGTNSSPRSTTTPRRLAP